MPKRWQWGRCLSPLKMCCLMWRAVLPDRAFGAGVSWKFGGKPTPAVAAQNAAHPAKVLQLRQEVAALRARQAETDRKLHKQVEMENELQQLRRALSELKKH